MKHFYVLSLVLLAGCSASMPHPQANISHPIRDTEGSPYVLIVGDELVPAWQATTNQPLWTWAGSATLETSGSVLARLPALLKVRHYDVLVVLVGIGDITTPAGNYFYGSCDIVADTDTCYNLDQMVLLAHAAGTKMLVCTLPYVTDPAIKDDYPEIEATEDVFNRFLGEEVIP